MSDLLLYPAPRRCVQSGPGCTLSDGFGVTGAPAGLVASVSGLGGRDAADGPVRLAIDGAAVVEAGDEAYRLVVGATGVRISARHATGLRWGLATLAQLRRCCGAALPGLVIDDAPAFAQRGFMLDIARDRVPTMETLFNLVELMAGLKLNHLQLYNEHAIAYVGHEGVWRNADPITPAELRTLDAFAAARGVALTANQNSFGHYERWLRHPRYAPLGELSSPHIFTEWGNSWIEPNTLCPSDPGSIALVEDLFRQQFACCSGPYANVGGDEPIDLGKGRSQADCAARGRGRVFAEYLGKVLRAAQKLGKRPQFWCDPHPNEDDSLPEDITALVWGYGREENFATRLTAHAAAGREVWVAPGTNNWCSYAGRTADRRGNLSKAAKEGSAAQAVGFLNTEWGDQGHRQQWPLALLGMADGAQAAWSGGSSFDDGAAGLHALGSAELGRWLVALGSCDSGISLGYGSPTFTDGDRGWSNWPETETLPAWQGVTAALAELETKLPAVGGLIEEECRLAIGLTRYAADRALARRQGHANEVCMAFAYRLIPLCATYRRLWLARSRYGGLEDSYTKLRALGR